MHAAVVSLRQAARRLHHSGSLEPSKYAWTISQLRDVTAELHASERRARERKTDPVNIAELLRAALAKVGLAVQLPDTVMVAGPAHTLRDLLCCLIEYALGVRPNSIDLRAAASREADSAGETFTIELVIQSLDIPDFLRRKLWEAAGARRGKVSIVSELDCCRIGLSIPVERRFATHG